MATVKVSSVTPCCADDEGAWPGWAASPATGPGAGATGWVGVTGADPPPPAAGPEEDGDDAGDCPCGCAAAAAGRADEGATPACEAAPAAVAAAGCAPLATLVLPGTDERSVAVADSPGASPSAAVPASCRSTVVPQAPSKPAAT